MKKILLCIGLAAFFISCQDNNAKTATTVKDSTGNNMSSSTAPADLPFTASYTSNWNDNVSDADLKTVMMTYKDWENNNMAGLGSALADSVELDMSNGDHFKKTKAEVMNMWSKFRDSLSSVKVNMETWHKMYTPDKKDSYIVTWYIETDTYKTGKVDSAYYHDINQLKDGKIVWYSQYRRAKKS